MSRKSVIDAALPLPLFIRRQQVLSLFRKMMRAAGRVDGAEVRQIFGWSFRLYIIVIYDSVTREGEEWT